MLVISGFCSEDLEAATELHQWISELDTNSNHELLLVGSSGLSDEQISGVMKVARQSFPVARAIRQVGPDPKSWPAGPNSMFKTAMEWVKKTGKGPFIWIEPDMIPVCPGWLNKLESDYRTVGKPFYGVIHNTPFRHLNGGAIYPVNIGAFNPHIFGASRLPFDCVRPELTLKHAHNSNLMQRMLADPSANQAMHFPDKESLNVIKTETVLFHGCKDLSLVQRLRERNGIHVPALKSKFSLGRIFKKDTEKKTIVVRRTGAIGDALAATCVATKLIEAGHKVIFQTAPACQEVVKYVSGIKVADPVGKCDVNLDEIYEKDPNRTTRHFAEMFLEACNRQLKTNFKPINFAPRLVAKARISNILAPRPWVAFVPRSNSFLERTVPDEVWIKAERDIDATCFWFGTHPTPHKDIAQLPLESVKDLIALETMDLVVSPDTGPAHIAAALGVPTIVISQSSAPELHLSDQRDWISIEPDNLDCLNCQATCRIDPANPPCQWIDPYAISTAVNKRLRGMDSDSVSVVIPIFRPPSERLNKCLKSVLGQVDEIVVTRDKEGIVPHGAMTHPRVKYVTARLGGIGMGPNCNLGVRHTNNQLILILNDDCFMDPGSVGRLIEAIKSDDKAGMVGMRLWYPGRKALQHGGTTRKPGDIGWGHKDHRSSNPSIKQTVECENVTAAAILVRREAFYAVSGFDEEYLFYYEDNDLCLRMRKAGWKIFYCPWAEAIHDEHSSTKTNPEMAKHVKHSLGVFTNRWKPYFLHNANNQLGNFEYLKS